jgi:hypothetical protein
MMTTLSFPVTAVLIAPRVTPELSKTIRPVLDKTNVPSFILMTLEVSPATLFELALREIIPEPVVLKILGLLLLREA